MQRSLYVNLSLKPIQSDHTINDNIVVLKLRFLIMFVDIASLR